MAAEDRWAVPALRARAGGPADRFAAWIGARPPAAVFFAALLSGLAALAGVSALLGLLVTDVLLSVDDVRLTDASTIESIVAERAPSLTDVSEVGSAAGGAPGLPIFVGLLALVCAVLREWRVAAFAVFVLVVESATHRVTTLLVPRNRPGVERLEDLPADASYPSGHTAAATAVYAGLVLLLTSAIPGRRLRFTAWGVAVALPVFVAASRVYRGMHHPLDVAGGLVVGVGAVLVLRDGLPAHRDGKVRRFRLRAAEAREDAPQPA